MAVSLKRMAVSQLSIWGIVTLFGIYFLFHLKEKLNFGIDLVGGTYITLAVQTDVAIENSLYARASHLISSARHANIISQEVPIVVSAGKLTITCPDTKTAYEIARLPEAKNIQTEGNLLTLRLTEKEEKSIKQAAVESNIAVLNSRLNASGVGEITVAAQGDTGIIVELPNVHDPEQAKKMIGTSALLEIKLVEDVGASHEAITKRFGGRVPEGYAIVSGRMAEQAHQELFLVKKHTDITGKLLEEAKADAYGGGRFQNEPVVNFKFSPEGSSLFYELTSHNVGRRIAIILDGVVISAPRVKEAIRESGRIDGHKDYADAKELAMFLSSGAFAAPVTCVEERSIGPTLGAKSISQGFHACLIALGLLFAFSILFYKTAGVFAALVLIYNLLLILFMMSWCGATLTMPGIAGIVLTIGMAIDASILIFEKIKEELAAGTPVRQAVTAGFDGALTVILDANITHLLVSIVLYKLGTGPIQGFAVTMIIGIIATLVTGIVLLKALFAALFDIFDIRTLKI